jgi:hypothetical protein
MTKSVIVCGNGGTTAASGLFVGLVGFGTTSTTESRNQLEMREAGTFSGLSFQTSAGSGTNTLKFRKNGADGNLVAAIAGTGVAQDLTHSDATVSGDLVNFGYTDTGTDGFINYFKVNLELSSGYGVLTGAGSYATPAAILDVGSSTRFIPLSGGVPTDGLATEADAGWRNRGFTTWEAMQVTVGSNARINTSTFKNRINSADGSGVCSFAAGVTGRVVAAGLGDAIGNAEIIDISVTLGAGVEDLQVISAAAFLKSTSIKQDLIAAGGTNGTVRAASATASFAPIGGFTTLTGLGANFLTPIGFAGKASNLRIYLSANTYTGSFTVKLLKNGSAAGNAVITLTIPGSSGAGWFENTTDTADFDDNDTFVIELDEGTSGSATIRMVGFTITPTQDLVPAIFTNTNTFYAPTVTPGAVTLTPSLYSNINTFYGPTTTSIVGVAPTLFSNTNVFYGPTVSPGEVTISPDLFENTSDFYAASISTGPVTIQPALYSNDATFYVLAPGLFTNSNTFHGPSVSYSYELTPSRFDNSNTIYNATVTGAYMLSASLVTNNNAFYAADVTVGAVDLAPSLFNNSNIFYSPNVFLAGAPQELLPDLFENQNTFFGPVVVASYTVTAELFSNVNAFYGHLVSADYSIQPALFVNVNVFYAPEITGGEEVDYRIENNSFYAMLGIRELIASTRSKSMLASQKSNENVAQASHNDFTSATTDDEFIVDNGDNNFIG